MVGGGAAGITIARKLASYGKMVVLCEAGGQYFSSESQSDYEGRVEGDKYFDLDVCRLRYFGGSTNHWGGWCRTFDAIDFDRSYLSEEMVWPIGKRDIDPYFEEACNIVEISSDFGDRPPNKFGVKIINFHFSPPVMFGEKYYGELNESTNALVYLNANLVNVSVTDRAIKSAEFKTYGDQTLVVNAQNFVFAMGGIENSRILQWLHSRHGDSLYDSRLPVGCYWMEHPTFTLGDAIVDKGLADQKYFGISEALQREKGILNCGLFIEGLGYQGTDELVADLLCAAPSVGKRIAGLAGKYLVCGGRVRSAWEQAPARENRVALSSNDRDKFGIPRPILYWKKSDLDRLTIMTSLGILNNWLLAEDLGRLKPYDWLLDSAPYPDDGEIGGNHHLGGTRMGNNPEIAVVDSNCLVFGTENLYMAGSSVFTSGGHANPTLPIVQFSLRLAEHLGKD